MPTQFSSLLGGLASQLGNAAAQPRSQQDQAAMQARSINPGAIIRTNDPQGLAQSLHFQNQDYMRQGERERAQRGSFRSDQMGSYMGQAWPRQPIPIYCDGWKSDTLSLERHGYKFMVEYDAMRMCYRIAIGKNGANSMILIDDMHYERFLRDQRPVEFHGEFITRMEIHETRTKQEIPVFVQKNMNDAYWCETEAMHGQRRTFDVRDLFPQSQTAPESEIILPDAKTVTEVLDLLLEKQTPRREEVRDNQRKRERKIATILQLEEIA